MYRQPDRILLIVAVSIVLYMLIAYYVSVVPQTVKIQQNHIVVCAEIISYRRSYKVSDLKFHFSYKGKGYEFIETEAPHRIEDEFDNGKKNMLIVIENGNPEQWRVLYKDEDFLYYNIQKADTLGINCQ